jgi:hypothetical protein
MTSKVLFPSLSESGWLTGSVTVADNLMCHIFCSDYSQTYLYNGHITSMAWMIRECQNDIPRLLSLMERTLTDYFNKYFYDVEVEVSENVNTLLSSKVDLNLYITFTDVEGTKHNFARMVEVADLKISKVTDLLTGKAL